MAYFYNMRNNSIFEDAIRLPEFRDATNKSEYRLIWLSASQFLPFRFLTPHLRAVPLVSRACGKSPFRRSKEEHFRRNSLEH